MVADVKPDCGRLLDPDEQSTVLQHVRYFSKNEQVLFVCHADDETREAEKKQLGYAWGSNQRDRKQVSSESSAIENTEEELLSDDNTCYNKTTRKNAKLVRFNSRPQICTEVECRLEFEVADAKENFRPFRARPSTPKPKKRERRETKHESSVLPPIRMVKTIAPASTHTRGVKHMVPFSTQNSVKSTCVISDTSQTCQDHVLTKKHLSTRKHDSNQGNHEKSSSPGVSPKLTPRRSTISLACRPPKMDTILRKVLTRGAFGGRMTCESDAISGRGRCVKRPEVADTERLASPAFQEQLYAPPSTRTHSLPRHIIITTRQHNSEINRELMTSPLSTLRLREAMDSSLSCASTTEVRNVAERADLAAQYDRMSPESHLEFIQRALAPRSESGEDFRGRSSTIGGGEKADVLLRRRPPGVGGTERVAGSLDKLNVQSALRRCKHRLLRARQDD